MAVPSQPVSYTHLDLAQPDRKQTGRQPRQPHPSPAPPSDQPPSAPQPALFPPTVPFPLDHSAQPQSPITLAADISSLPPKTGSPSHPGTRQ